MAIKCIRSRAGWINSCTNGKQMDAIVHRRCLISKPIAGGQIKKCTGSCWRRQTYRKRHGVHSINRRASMYRCGSIITRLVSCFCRNSSQAPITFQWIQTTQLHHPFQWYTTFHSRNSPSMIHHFWAISYLDRETMHARIYLQNFNPFLNKLWWYVQRKEKHLSLEFTLLVFFFIQKMIQIECRHMESNKFNAF